jgi:hypothetical protein
MTCKIKDRNRNNIVVIVTMIRTGPTGAPFLAGKYFFFLLQDVQFGSRDLAASYLLDAEGFFRL